jgi:hypothetical protein
MGVFRPEEEATMTRRMPYLLVAAIVLAVPGCSYTCNFEAHGVIRDAADGQPVPNARVELLRADGTPHLLSSGDPAAVMTDPQGSFQVAFWTVPSGKDELTGWTARVSAQGYEPETIAVGPVKEPNRGDVTVYLVFHVSLRKAR